MRRFTNVVKFFILILSYFVILEFILGTFYICEINCKHKYAVLAATRSKKQTRLQYEDAFNKTQKKSTSSKHSSKSKTTPFTTFSTLSKRELRSEKQALKLLQKAQKLRAKGKNAEAIDAYKEALFYNPTLLSAALELADLYMELNEYLEAKNIYEYSIKFISEAGVNIPQEQMGDYYYKLGKCYFELADYDSASNYLVKANEMLKNTKPDLYFVLAKIFILKNNPDMAFRYMNQALKIDPYYTDGWVEMIEYAFKMGRDKDISVALEGLKHCDTIKYNYYKDKALKAKIKLIPVKFDLTTKAQEDPYSE